MHAALRLTAAVLALGIAGCASSSTPAPGPTCDIPTAATTRTTPDGGGCAPNEGTICGASDYELSCQPASANLPAPSPAGSLDCTLATTTSVSAGTIYCCPCGS